MKVWIGMNVGMKVDAGDEEEAVAKAKKAMESINKGEIDLIYSIENVEESKN